MNKKVLVLEDEENIRKFVVINLNRAGYETVEFEMGEPVVEYIKNNDDAAIAILDVMLPDIGGFERVRPQFVLSLNSNCFSSDQVRFLQQSFLHKGFCIFHTFFYRIPQLPEVLRR